MARSTMWNIAAAAPADQRAGQPRRALGPHRGLRGGLDHRAVARARAADRGPHRGADERTAAAGGNAVAIHPLATTRRRAFPGRYSAGGLFQAWTELRADLDFGPAPGRSRFVQRYRAFVGVSGIAPFRSRAGSSTATPLVFARTLRTSCGRSRHGSQQLTQANSS